MVVLVGRVRLHGLTQHGEDAERLLTVLLVYGIDVATEPGGHHHGQTAHTTLHIVQDTLVKRDGQQNVKKTLSDTGLCLF